MSPGFVPTLSSHGNAKVAKPFHPTWPSTLNRIEPAIVLASDQQLHDLVRFGTSSQEFGVITIDPTFSLGKFDVTPLTYRHLLLITRRSNQPPIFLGPLLIHYKKSFSTYLFFASSLIGQCPQLEGIRAFGTDGEVALIKAFTHEFGFSQHLTCFVHVRRNIKEKLNECNVPSDVAKQILDDIFGRRVGSVLEEGLVDSVDNDDFQFHLSLLSGAILNVLVILIWKLS